MSMLPREPLLGLLVLNDVSAGSLGLDRAQFVFSSAHNYPTATVIQGYFPCQKLFIEPSPRTLRRYPRQGRRNYRRKTSQRLGTGLRRVERKHIRLA